MPWTPSSICFFHYPKVDIGPALPQMPLLSLGTSREKVGTVRRPEAWVGLRGPDAHSYPPLSAVHSHLHGDPVPANHL